MCHPLFKRLGSKGQENKKSGRKQKSLEVSLMRLTSHPSPALTACCSIVWTPAESQLWRHLCSSWAHSPCAACSPPWDLWDAVMELPFSIKNKQQAVGIEAASFSLQPCQAILVPACTARKPERPRAPRHGAGSRGGSGSWARARSPLDLPFGKECNLLSGTREGFFLSAVKDPWGFWWEEAYSMIFILFSQVLFKRGDANDMV